jgi:hypothetical protein
VKKAVTAGPAACFVASGFLDGNPDDVRGLFRDRILTKVGS